MHAGMLTGKGGEGVERDRSFGIVPNVEYKF